MPWYEQHRACLDEADLAEMACGHLNAGQVTAFDAWAHECERGPGPARVMNLLKCRGLLLWSATEDKPADFVGMLQRSWGGAELAPPWPVLHGASTLDLDFCRTIRRKPGEIEVIVLAMRTFKVDPLVWAKAIMDKSHAYLAPAFTAFVAAVSARRSPTENSDKGRTYTLSRCLPSTYWLGVATASPLPGPARANASDLTACAGRRPAKMSSQAGPGGCEVSGIAASLRVSSGVASGS